MITIRVTQEHIDKGTPKQADDCPVFHAGIEAGLDMEEVGFEFVWYSDGGYLKYVYDLPDDICQRIFDYDEGRGMEPFEFTFDERSEALVRSPERRSEGE